MGMKEAYQQMMEARLAEWGTRINELKAKADKAEAQAKVEYYKQIDALRNQQAAVQEKLRGLKDAGEGAWEDLKAGLEKAWDDLQTSIETAISKVK